MSDFRSFLRKLIADAEPLSQNTGPDNLGFGWLYYGMMRNLRPDYVVAIGSCRGFMPFCAARGVQDNGAGRVFFIDPSYSGWEHPGWGGQGFWNDSAQVERWIAEFGLTGWITHLKMTSEQAFPQVRNEVAGANVGVLIIDGAHTFENSLQDFELYSSLMSEGVVMFHDAVNSSTGVPRTLEVLRGRRYPVITLDREVGLAIVGIRNVPSVEDRWGYLCAPSNRGELLLPHALSVVRPGDSVLDIYCGYSPLASLLNGVEVFGWDRDPLIIQRLRRDKPQHRWEQIDEAQLPFCGLLPEHVDVLLGLGVSYGCATWDPRYVLDNVRYLLGRYAPRAALFESAAEYSGGRILDDLEAVMGKLGYRCRDSFIATDMNSFARRRVMVGERNAINRGRGPEVGSTRGNYGA